MTAILIYGRPPIVFGGLLCAIGVMWTYSPILYMTGGILLFIAMCFDLVDGWFAARFQTNTTLAHLADRIMDKIVFSIIFPLVAVGAMWRLHFVPPAPSKAQLLHGIFILLLCITVLVRDNFAHFIRNFAIRQGLEPESKEFTRLRTMVAAPVGVLLYAFAFYIPDGPDFIVYSWLAWLGTIPIGRLFFIEIIFLIINFGSIAGYCRKYGGYCLDELCNEDDRLRRRILSVFPNALTIMNAMMGMLAVFFAYQDRIREAYLFLLGAVLFDKLDGALARKLKLNELRSPTEKPRRIDLGAILDDVSDAISFCIVPAWIFHITFTNSSDPVIGKLPVAFIALGYAGLGIVRLIYFTLDRRPIPGFFKGMPTPAAALLVVAPIMMYSQAAQEMPEAARFWGIFSFCLMIFASILMNLYPIRYLHMGRFMNRRPWFARMNMILIFFSIFTPYFGYVALFYLFFYVLSPLMTWRIDPRVAAMETKVPAGEKEANQTS